MKILAEKHEGYILDVTKDELANILGYHSAYSDEFRRAAINDAIKHNTPVKISDIYKDYERTRYYKENERLKEAATKLKQMIKALEPIEEVIKILPTLE